METTIPYCGIPPVPGELLHRFNTDPVLIAGLLVAALLSARLARGGQREVRLALAGWVAAAAALVSPLCALSVSLFAARVGQHMVLVLIAAPLVAAALPGAAGGRSLWSASAAFFVALWFWHMPAPYAATFRSDAIYWSMHVSLFGSAVWLWHALLCHGPRLAASALAAGTVSSMQMGFLGAVLTFSSRPLFAPHYFTTEAWGLSPLADQQLGGALMWVPGCALFIWVTLRSLAALWRTLEPARAA